MRKFQSTLLMRGATLLKDDDWAPILFQSTLLMRGATLLSSAPASESEISIHAPHARSDYINLVCIAEVNGISIHAPHARSDDYC